MRWDQQGESFVHVGQWDPLVGAVLVFIAAIFEYYAGKNKTESEQENDRDNETELSVRRCDNCRSHAQASHDSAGI
jgi:hypothetical protein